LKMKVSRVLDFLEDL